MAPEKEEKESNNKNIKFDWFSSNSSLSKVWRNNPNPDPLSLLIDILFKPQCGHVSQHAIINKALQCYRDALANVWLYSPDIRQHARVVQTQQKLHHRNAKISIPTKNRDSNNHNMTFFFLLISIVNDAATYKNMNIQKYYMFFFLLQTCLSGGATDPSPLHLSMEHGWRHQTKLVSGPWNVMLSIGDHLFWWSLVRF